MGLYLLQKIVSSSRLSTSCSLETPPVSGIAIKMKAKLTTEQKKYNQNGYASVVSKVEKRARRR